MSMSTQLFGGHSPRSLDVVERARMRTRGTSTSEPRRKRARYDTPPASDARPVARGSASQSPSYDDDDDDDERMEDEEEGEDGAHGIPPRDLHLPNMLQPVHVNAGESHVPLSLMASRSRRAVMTREREIDEEREARIRELLATNGAHGNYTYSCYCFICEYGNRAFDSTDLGCRPFAEMTNIITSNYGHMSDISIGNLVHAHYMNHLYRSTLDPATGEPTLPPLTSEMVVEHIAEHTLNQTLNIGKSKRVVNRLIDIVSNRLFSEDDNISYKSVDILIKLIDRQVKLYNIREDTGGAGRSGSGGDAINLDPSAVNSVANLRRIRPLIQTGDAVALVNTGEVSVEVDYADNMSDDR